MTMQQLSLFDFEAEPSQIDDLEQNSADSKIAELINRRRRQIIVHSTIYYRCATSLISDATFDAWSRELVELQRQHPGIAGQCDWAELFSDYDGSTGFHLCGIPWGYSKALELLRCAARL